MIVGVVLVVTQAVEFDAVGAKDVASGSFDSGRGKVVDTPQDWHHR